ncbi:uncharacterized protein LOC128228504 [Mya arenaria]|uniref:uncharacterized protein LOC128228504 n=1 Tax=Mya arenaria TaxID=6604 RepID=UPI0022E8F795|nr:uncharacterized protein LOC128228504 [Mya arenaria]
MEKLGKNDVVKVKEIDATVKNKFSFAWLEREIDLLIVGKPYKYMNDTMKNRTVENLKVNKFSQNIDESTSTNLHRVLTILVSYFDKQKSSVIEHLASLDVIKVDAETLTEHIVSIFTENEIPWSNLVSVLMDSCSVMRGSKSGVETRLKQYAPHLLDIDGDTCHHVHNASKKFCAPFDCWIEHLFTDIANDVKWSTDTRDAMKEVAILLDVKFTMPERYVSHRWLSCYDVAVNTKRMSDVHKVFYYSFLRTEDQAIYSQIIDEVLQRRRVGENATREIRAIQKAFGKKKLTTDGKNRKGRIIERLFEKSVKSELTLNFYISVLPMLKCYVTMFETKEPLIHTLMEKQENLMAKFLACIVRLEVVIEKSGSKLCKVDLGDDSDVFLREKDMFIGAANKKLISSLSGKDPVVQDFRKRAATAYITCARYLQHKLPLKNQVLRAASGISPDRRACENHQ